MNALFSPRLFSSGSRMTHPYRLIVTSGGARTVVISLVKVYPLEAMPTRVRHPTVVEVLYSRRISAPRNVPTGVCNPPRPGPIPNTVYERELSRAYDLLDKLAQAPTEVSHEQARNRAATLA